MAFRIGSTRYTPFTARWNGWRDGTRGIPAADQADPSPYERALCNVAEEFLARIAREWEKRDAKLMGEYCATLHEYHIALDARREAEGDAASTSGALQQARQMIQQLYGREHVAPWLYWLLIATLGVFELPLNAYAFEIFGDRPILNYLTAFLLALLLPACAHVFGRLLRDQPLRKGIFHAEVIGSVLLGTLPVLLVAALALLRGELIEAEGLAAQLGVELEPWVVGLLFLSLNLLVYAVATVLAYYHHDPELKRRRRELEDAEHEHEDDRREVARLAALLQTLGRRRNELAQVRQSEFEATRHRARETAHAVERLINHYRLHNLRARSDGATPPCFRQEPDIDWAQLLPAELRQLDWRCPEMPAPGPPLADARGR